MNIGAIDDETLALSALIRTLQETCPDAKIYGFDHSDELLEFMKTMPLDVVFTDIEMQEINGLELAKKLKEIRPDVNIIFVTGHTQYMLDAFSLRASGYLMKPARKDDVTAELLQLRNPPAPIPEPGKLRVQTFGNFEVFFGEERLHFPRAKAKEMLAYLIDRRGASCSMAELAAILWQDKPYNRSQLKQLHTHLAELKKVLKRIGLSEVLVKTRNSISIKVSMLDCDYYRFLQGETLAINAFTNEYMTNYSWAEFTVGALSTLSSKL